MAKAAIRAITFDLWDTVFVDDSDEPKRAAQGLACKQVERCNLVQKFLEQHGPIAREMVDLAYATTNAAFHQVWHSQNITWTVGERLSVLLKGLGRDLPEAEFNELVRLHEEMELAARPDLAPGVAQALATLQGKYQIGVVSDVIFSPGRTLRQLLAGYDILKFFRALAFSDEVGCAKPSTTLFEAAATGLGVKPNEMVHIGDRESKDVEGAHAVGARAILCTAVKDRGSENTNADAICSNFLELPTILEKLNAH